MLTAHAYEPQIQFDGITAAASRVPLLLLAHGAGAPMDTQFLQDVTARLVARGVGVARFEFAYMAMRRHSAPRRPPPKVASLAGEFHAAMAAVQARYPDAPLWIGGKSMGGRVASMIADTAFAAGRIEGCVCVGYPFHPANKPDKLRTAHLTAMRCPTLILQGDRDPLGNRCDVTSYELSPAIVVHWVGDGDHDLRPRKASGQTLDGNLAAAADRIAAFIHASVASGGGRS